MPQRFPGLDARLRSTVPERPAYPRPTPRSVVNPRSPRIIELLNDALALELKVANTYFLNARMLENWGFPMLGKVFYDLSIDEMRDADKLIQRIIFFEGRPRLTAFGPLVIGEDPAEILQNALAGEYAAVALFTDAAKECRDLGDLATATLFEAAALEEETHADFFEGQVDAMERVGVERYLAQHLAPGSGPAE